MEQPPIVFVSGLPRSGSTLLVNLLGQNPRHHVTATNGLLSMLLLVRDNWQANLEFRAQGIANIQPRITSMARAMVEGFYRQEFQQGKVVFDKDRGWLAYIEMMEQVLGRPVSVIVTVRDVRAILASIEKLHQRFPMNAPRMAKYALSQVVEGRAALAMAEDGDVGMTVNRLRDALRRPHKSRILMIPYNDLCIRPREILQVLHEQLGLPPFNYDPDHVKQITHEDDSVYHAPAALHTIRSKVEKPDDKPWEGILPEALCERLARDYADIQAYAEGKS